MRLSIGKTEPLHLEPQVSSIREAWLLLEQLCTEHPSLSVQGPVVERKPFHESAISSPAYSPLPTGRTVANGANSRERTLAPKGVVTHPQTEIRQVSLQGLAPPR